MCLSWGGGVVNQACAKVCQEVVPRNQTKKGWLRGFWKRKPGKRDVKSEGSNASFNFTPFGLDRPCVLIETAPSLASFNVFNLPCPHESKHGLNVHRVVP